MSKEATGANGSRLGSSEYWSSVNRSTVFGGLMQRDSEPNYYGTLQVIGVRANMMVDEVYEDLQNHIKLVRSIPSDHRSSLAKQVQALYDICRMGGVICSRSSECVSILNLSGFYVSINPFSNDTAVQNAVRKIKNNSDFFASECVDMIQQAADWSISFAAGSNEKKRAFLEDISQGKGKDFLQEVLDEYRSSSGTADTRGRCGYSIGSRDYREYVERTVFRQELSTLGSYDYDGIIKGALEVIADQLERDLTRNERENNYITDDTARSLKEVVRDLNRCDVSTGSAESTIERLAWFVGGDPAKIRQLQNKLNELGIGERLEEDGVYGAKTAASLSRFFGELVRGTYPMLVRVDPLQSDLTGIKSVPIEPKGKRIPSGTIIDSFQDFSSRSKNNGRGTNIFRVDYDDELLHHINTVGRKGFGLSKKGIDPENAQYATWALPRAIMLKLNHTKISPKAYDFLKNFDGHAKKVRVSSGKVFAVIGPVLDVLELSQAIAIDKTDADRKLGKTTVSTVISIGGSWAIGSLGAQGGAMAGALLGSAILPGPGTAIGGTIGGFAGGVIGSHVGSYSGDVLGEYIIDITELE